MCQIMGIVDGQKVNFDYFLKFQSKRQVELMSNFQCRIRCNGQIALMANSSVIDIFLNVHPRILFYTNLVRIENASKLNCC